MRSKEPAKSLCRNTRQRYDRLPFSLVTLSAKVIYSWELINHLVNYSQTEEEIKKFCSKDDLDEIGRIEYLLRYVRLASKHLPLTRIFYVATGYLCKNAMFCKTLDYYQEAICEMAFVNELSLFVWYASFDI